MTTFFDFVVPACWITFIVFWIINAWRVKATAEKQSVGSALMHRIPLGISYALMIARRLPSPLNLPITSHADWARVTGDVVCVLGWSMTLWARWTLAGNWSSDVTFKQGHELIRRGPYRVVRHPIYAGILVMCLGTAVEIGRLHAWLAPPFMTVAFWIKLKQEERLLLRHFPAEYPAYQKQVKALIPFLI